MLGDTRFCQLDACRVSVAIASWDVSGPFEAYEICFHLGSSERLAALRSGKTWDCEGGRKNEDKGK